MKPLRSTPVSITLTFILKTVILHFITIKGSSVPQTHLVSNYKGQLPSLKVTNLGVDGITRPLSVQYRTLDITDSSFTSIGFHLCRLKLGQMTKETGYRRATWWVSLKGSLSFWSYHWDCVQNALWWHHQMTVSLTSKLLISYIGSTTCVYCK